LELRRFIVLIGFTIRATSTGTVPVEVETSHC